ncbi:hypothetical protein PV396_11060 [Streptomyces sp. ME02-8801-2C]|uniref:hypothetical protein n=1 Tax=Streptomyces sp. ME02-8801-2C TaxID=3028680 RepID=UPI0029AC6600|nr:hypothetical protein [Streptomyces sp. ME02-8801-2C]MDX3452478.1 hypothetical protein [Streptomyces sp. ME02-8801-2C]
MPIAMLLVQKLAGTFGTAVKTLTPWITIVDLESTIVARSRGAFLVHWFGPRLPLDGLSLRVRLVNLRELEAQFRAARQSVRTSADGPNLTAPVLGFAGAVAGMLLSPINTAVVAGLLLRFSDGSVKAIAKALALLLYPLAVLAAPVLIHFVPASAGVIGRIAKGTGTLVGGGLLAAGAAFPVAAALGDRREVQALYDLGGAAARIANATVDLLDQLHGPREAVRNPLLRDLLRLGDRLAALLAQALGVAAVVVVEFGPRLEPAVRSLVRLGDLASAVTATLGTVADGLKDRLRALAEGSASVPAVLADAGRVARRMLVKAVRAMSQQLDLVIQASRTPWELLDTTLSAYGENVLVFVGKLFTDHPVARVFLALRAQVQAIKEAWAEAGPKATPTPGVPIQIPPGVAARMYGLGQWLSSPPPSPKNLVLNALPKLPDVPDLPALPGLPDTAELRSKAGGDAVPPLTGRAIEEAAKGWGLSSYGGRPAELSAAARTALSRTERRLGVFAAQRRAMDAAGDAPALVVLLNLQQFERVRALLTPVVEQVLPPRMRATVLPRIAGVLTAIDQEHQEFLDRKGTGTGPAGQADGDLHPVLDVPSGARLAPVVRTLRLRMPGADPAAVRRFQNLVTERLRRIEYPVTGPLPQRAGGA